MDVLTLPPEGTQPLPEGTADTGPALDGLVIERLADTEYVWPVEDVQLFIVKVDGRELRTLCKRTKGL